MKTDLNRRNFLKIAGITAVAVGGYDLFKEVKGRKDEKPLGSMTYRSHPSNGDKVSLLGYGCMRWPMTTGKDGKEVVDQEMTNQLVDYAIAHGVNYFDAAPMYLDGQCEKVTGEALKRYPRDCYYLATKLSNFRDTSQEAAMKMYHKSFEDLQTDYIDYYLLHSIKTLDAFNKRFVENGMMDFLLEERKAGRIRNLGFSFHGSAKGFDELIALHDTYHWDFVQIQLNYVDWNHASSRNTNASYLQAELDKRGIPSIVMEPLLGGRLAKVPGHVADRLKEKEPEMSIASWAFRFAGSQPGVLTVLSGMTYMEHLQDNLKSFSPMKEMTEEELLFIEDIAKMIQEYPLINCRNCKYCLPCPYGIDIPAILLHYNKCVNEGYICTDSSSENYRKARRAYLVSYDRAVMKPNQADHCIDCWKCVENCPQSINIPLELYRINSYIEDLKRNKF